MDKNVQWSIKFLTKKLLKLCNVPYNIKIFDIHGFIIYEEDLWIIYEYT
jgi:hypothetical protein